ncbi:serine/threonine/tyrosine-interacting-like protein 1 [Ptychodera flava]|uniref:serine/threonine/tyrosine-interacting-like protein 1 n=1 Tax=Ptychodera flava TaxID=63121 RepID=UPI00396A53FC
MSGMTMCEPTELYNILQQGTTAYPCLSDPNYLLLLDARKEHEYNESHIITSKKAPRTENEEFLVPYDAELECKTHVVVIDNSTRSLAESGPAIDCAQVMSEMGSKNPVKILRGGYEDFSALYPFLRTQKIIYMPRELDDLKTYPIEVLPGQVYLGDYEQSCSAVVQKDLKIKARVNVTLQNDELGSAEQCDTLQLAVTDDNEADLSVHFQSACQFIESHSKKGKVVLVYSELGISRSVTIVVAYLMYFYKWSLEDAYRHVEDCKPTIRPNRAFIEQLSQWEKEIHEETLTDISDPNY